MPIPGSDMGGFPDNRRSPFTQPDMGGFVLGRVNPGSGLPTVVDLRSDMAGFPREADPYFNNVSLLIHWSGRNGVTVTTANENRQLDRSRFQHVFASATAGGLTDTRRLFDDSTGYSGTATMAFADAPEFRMGLFDFTYEVAVFLNSLPTGGGGFNIGGQHGGTVVAGRWHLGTGTAVADVSKLALYVDDVAVLTSANTLALGINFIAYSRVGGVGYLFNNGAIVASAPDLNDYSAAVGFCCPRNGSITPATPITQGPTVGGVGVRFEDRLTQFVGRYSNAYKPQTDAWPDQ